MTFDALGNQDELNAALGVAREYCSQANNGLADMIIEIQSRLFDVGAAIATPIESSSEDKRQYTLVCHVSLLILFSVYFILFLLPEYLEHNALFAFSIPGFINLIDFA